MTRYPWDEFWRWAEARGLNMSVIAERVGRDTRQLYRWREKGSIGEAEADRVALALGAMPGDIWSTWHEAGLAAAEAEDARQRRLKADRLRRWRQKYPDARERARAYRRAYYAENRAYELRRQKAYDAQRRAAS